MRLVGRDAGRLFVVCYKFNVANGLILLAKLYSSPSHTI
jgi:hypothetical protein